MNLTHNGKIGRLPKAVQEQLNHHLENGEKGRGLAVWLNALPEVQAVLAAEFDGKPIREQNLSEWRKGGYKNWLWRQEALEMARDMATETGELQPDGAAPLTDQMAGWVTVRYLLAVRKLVEKSDDGEIDLKTLRELCHDVVAVRRGDHSAARLKMEQERLEREREKTEEEVVAHFQRWLKNPAVRDLICQDYVSPEERERRLREIFGLAPKPPEPAAPDSEESSLVKPSQTQSGPIQLDQTDLPGGPTPVAIQPDERRLETN
jgi:hypothetical protein